MTSRIKSKTAHYASRHYWVSANTPGTPGAIENFYFSNQEPLHIFFGWSLVAVAAMFRVL